jgi:hypothetical protein
VPSISTGFWVATTRNGRGTARAVTVHRDVPLLHDLQQRRLRLGRRPVDLIGDHDVGEDRSTVELEFASSLIEDRYSGHVRGKEVGGELDAAPFTAYRRRDRSGEGGLADTRYVLQQQMPLGEKAGEREFDDLGLAQDHRAHIARESRRDIGEFLDFVGRKGRRVVGHEGNSWRRGASRGAMTPPPTPPHPRCSGRSRSPRPNA